MSVLRDAAKAALRDFDDLVAESYGVSGLLRNGDVAPWSSLCEGGHFEAWTVNIEALRTLIAEIESEIDS